MSLFNELKHRNVFKVSVAYIVIAWLVMQVADVVLNNISAPPWVFHVLLLFLVIGLPFAVFFAWAFELTPEGLKREHEVDRTQSITTQTGKKLNTMIFVVMARAGLEQGGRSAPCDRKPIKFILVGFFCSVQN